MEFYEIVNLLKRVISCSEQFKLFKFSLYRMLSCKYICLMAVRDVFFFFFLVSVVNIIESF